MSQKNNDDQATVVSITGPVTRRHQEAQQAVAEATKAEKALKSPKLPKELSEKKLSKLENHIMDTQRKAIDLLIEALREKDRFISEWGKWLTAVRECSEAVRTADKQLRSIGNRQVVELTQALDASRKEVETVRSEVGELTKRVRHLLGQ